MRRSAVIFVDNGVQDEEFLYPYYRLQEANFTVEVASGNPNPIFTKMGVPIKVTKATSDVDHNKYNVAIVPGGWESPERVRQDQNVLQVLREMNKEKKVIGGICHGPCVLISANLVKGLNMTCYKGMKDDLINAGALYADVDVVKDGNIVTAPHYRNNPQFMREVLAAYETYFLENLAL